MTTLYSCRVVHCRRQALDPSECAKCQPPISKVRGFGDFVCVFPATKPKP